MSRGSGSGGGGTVGGMAYTVRVHWSKEEDWSVGPISSETPGQAVDEAVRRMAERTGLDVEEIAERAHVTVRRAVNVT